MISVAGEQLQETSEYVRSEARQASVEVTYHGRPELVILSLEDYAWLRQNRKLAVRRADMPVVKIERVVNNRMDAEHADLDGLMDD